MKLIIPGPPIAQKRHRTFRRGNFNVNYDPDSKEKEKIRIHLKKQIEEEMQHAQEWPLFDVGYVISATLTYEMPIPKSTSKKVRKMILDYNLPHVVKPDTDNLAKKSLDCLTGIVFKDDCQINDLHVIKKYSEDPKTIIELSIEKIKAQI